MVSYTKQCHSAVKRGRWPPDPTSHLLCRIVYPPPIKFRFPVLTLIILNLNVALSNFYVCYVEEAESKINTKYTKFFSFPKIKPQKWLAWDYKNIFFFFFLICMPDAPPPQSSRPWHFVRFSSLINQETITQYQARGGGTFSYLGYIRVWGGGNIICIFYSLTRYTILGCFMINFVNIERRLFCLCSSRKIKTYT